MGATRQLIAAAVGVLVGVAHVLLTGIFAIQVEGWRTDTTYDLNNELVAFSSHPFSGLWVFASALVSALTFYAVAVLPRRYGARLRSALVAGFVTAVVALVAYSFSIAVETMMLPGGDRIDYPYAYGWQGWVREAGRSPAVYLVVLLALGSLLPLLSRPPRAWKPHRYPVV